MHDSFENQKHEERNKLRHAGSGDNVTLDLNGKKGSYKPVRHWLIRYIGPSLLVAISLVDIPNLFNYVFAGLTSRFLPGYLILGGFIYSIVLYMNIAKLGAVSGMDLAQLCKEHFEGKTSAMIWAFNELSIIVRNWQNLAGCALMLQIMLKWSFGKALLLSILTVLVLLWIRRLGNRLLEFIFLLLTLVIHLCMPNVFFRNESQDEKADVMKGLVTYISPGRDSSLAAISVVLQPMILAHNIFLYSSLVLTREIKRDDRAVVNHAIRSSKFDIILAFFSVGWILGLIIWMFGGEWFDMIEELTLQSLQHYVAFYIDIKTGNYWCVLLITAAIGAVTAATLASEWMTQNFFELRRWSSVKKSSVLRLAVLGPLVSLTIFTDFQSAYNLFNTISLLALPVTVIPLVKILRCRVIMGDFTISRFTQLFLLSVPLTILLLRLNAFLRNSEGLSGKVLLILAFCAFYAGILVKILRENMQTGREHLSNSKENANTDPEGDGNANSPQGKRREREICTKFLPAVFWLVVLLLYTLRWWSCRSSPLLFILRFFVG
eukprot:TRINITY_DN1359_c0_g1_i9.p1 TRINITY_DN1359_c0_g1~~TRINITY_DN1359_c0_g1_i9.p1  ORF type:complete len:548 (-),score=62.38 TRINITY_DN1359_c0_g1_i9:186-1829(-)